MRRGSGMTLRDLDQITDAAVRERLLAEHPDARGKAAKRSKYRAVPTTYNGVRYASKAEAKRAEELDQAKRDEFVLWWIGQPKFRLGCPENVYIPDFLVCMNDRQYPKLCATHCEDVKGGVETEKFRRDKRLWARYGPMPLYVIRMGKGVTEIIKPREKSR